MIRQATKQDREQMAELVYVIFKDMELPLVSRYDKKTLCALVVEAMADKAYRYSETRAVVKEIKGKVAGVAFSYPAKDEPSIDQAWEAVAHRHQLAQPRQLFYDPETLPNEWYLDTICVADWARGQGIGTQLLHAVETVAKHHGYTTLGLCCDQANPKAKQLYTRLGYQVVTQQILSGHDYDHMQKKLS